MNKFLSQYKILIIFFTDLIMGFFALSSMLFIRYGKYHFSNQFNNHFLPFLIIIFSFIFSFYIFNLYSFRFNRNITDLTNSFIKGILVSFFISISIFYIFGNFFELTPKTNLVIFTLIYAIFDFYIRIITKRYFTKNKINRKIIIINKNNNELVDELKNNQNIGYEIIKETNNLNYEDIIKLKPDLVVIDSFEIGEFNNIYPLIKKNISVSTINNFYEEIFQKIPIEKIEKEKVVDYLSKNKSIFNFIKRLFDVFLSLLLIIIFSPIFFIIIIIIKTTSKGSVLFKQKRISLNDREFIIYKFRSMYLGSEKNGAVWTDNNNNDSRITPIGKLLRNTHLDELPQLFNIIKGNISFVGPRPERPEFTKILEKEITYYDIRHSVKAGLTGWAQVNYKYGSSVQDAKEKLKYDFYYIKNRTIFLDILIILKTIAKIFAH